MNRMECLVGRGSRIGAGVLLVVASLLKVAFVHNQNSWLPIWAYYSGLVVESLVGVGLIVTGARWPLLLGLLLAGMFLALNIVHIHDPRPCGCLGPWHSGGVTQWWYAGVVGACCAVALGCPGQGEANGE